MFTFGTFDATSTDGLSAVLTVWPGLPAVELHTVASPGRDGVFYADSGLSSGEWVFDLVAVAPTPEAVLAIAGQVTRALNPRAGQQALRVDIAPGWTWSAVTSSLTPWTRAGWVPGSECRLRATLTFATPDPYGYATPDESWSWASAGTRTITRSKGNTDSYPEITVKGTLTAAQQVTLTLNGQPVTVQGPLTSAQELRLDYAAMDFGLWQGETKIVSAVSRMSSFERLTLPVGESAFAASSNGALTEVTVKANSRRV